MSLAETGFITLGGWYIVQAAEETTSVYLKNDRIELVKASFSVNVQYATKALETLNFYVLNASVTEDFTLPPDHSKSAIHIHYLLEPPTYYISSLFPPCEDAWVNRLQLYICV